MSRSPLFRESLGDCFSDPDCPATSKEPLRSASSWKPASPMRPGPRNRGHSPSAKSPVLQPLCGNPRVSKDVGKPLPPHAAPRSMAEESDHGPPVDSPTPVMNAEKALRRSLPQSKPTIIRCPVQVASTPRKHLRRCASRAECNAFSTLSAKALVIPVCTITPRGNLGRFLS